MEKKSVLLVENDVPVRELLRAALKGGKYEVLEASNSAEAHHHLENPVHLALVDCAPHSRNGFEVLKLIRKKNPALPTIMMTAYGCENMAIQALRAGVADYVKKPLNLGYLLGRVSQILEGGNGGHVRHERVASRDEFIIDGAAAYIRENHADALSLDKLAAMTCMNKYKFSRSFKERHKCGFVEYLNKVRIKNALELLENPDLNITDIAFSAGYGSIQHFERVFIKHQGLAPRAYRQSIRQKKQ